MTRFVLDSSAVLAMLWAEPGAGVVNDSAENAMISSVNLSEIVAKIHDRGFGEDKANFVVSDLKPEIVPFDRDQAIAAGHLRASTRQKGLSLGDRACLALALQQKATVLTADKAWSELDLGLEIKVIR